MSKGDGSCQKKFILTNGGCRIWMNIIAAEKQSQISAAENIRQNTEFY